MADPTPNRPLWEVMQGAYCSQANTMLAAGSHRVGYAAELRAIAEEIERRDIDPLEIEDWLREEALIAEEGNE